jgi:hypothetical protein
LIAVAEHRARLGKSAGDGKSTQGEHIQALVRSGRLPQKALDGPDIPEEIEYLWAWFNELERVRGVTEAGLSPIGYTEIDAWRRLTGRVLRPHEVEGLVALDISTRFPREVK